MLLCCLGTSDLANEVSYVNLLVLGVYYNCYTKPKQKSRVQINATWVKVSGFMRLENGRLDVNHNGRLGFKIWEWIQKIVYDWLGFWIENRK